MRRRRPGRQTEHKLKALEDRKGTSVPWRQGPPGQEPDYPRPLKRWTLRELAAFQCKEIADYCDAYEAGEQYRQSPFETWLSAECFHEHRWQRHRILRPHWSLRSTPSKNWQDAAEELRLELHDEDWDELGVAEMLSDENAIEGSSTWPDSGRPRGGR